MPNNPPGYEGPLGLPRRFGTLGSESAEGNHQHIFPRLRLFKTAADTQTPPNNTAEAIRWNDISTLSRAFFRKGVDQTAIILVKKGFYEVNTTVTFAGNATGTRGVRLSINGTATPYRRVFPSSAGTTTGAIFYDTIEVDLPDTILIVEGIQNSGAGLAVNPGNYVTFVDITYMGQAMKNHKEITSW